MQFNYYQVCSWEHLLKVLDEDYIYPKWIKGALNYSTNRNDKHKKTYMSNIILLTNKGGENYSYLSSQTDIFQEKLGHLRYFCNKYFLDPLAFKVAMVIWRRRSFYKVRSLTMYIQFPLTQHRINWLIQILKPPLSNPGITFNYNQWSGERLNFAPHQFPGALNSIASC